MNIQFDILLMILFIVNTRTMSQRMDEVAEHNRTLKHAACNKLSRKLQNWSCPCGMVSCARGVQTNDLNPRRHLDRTDGCSTDDWYKGGKGEVTRSRKSDWALYRHIHM